MQFTTALLVLVVSTAAIAQITTDSNVQLRGISQTSDQVDIETYDDEAGLGITVSSTAQSLLITSSTGEVLVHYKKPFYKERNGEELDQLIVFNGQPFLDHRRDNKATGYSITQQEADELTQAADQESDYSFATAIGRIVQNSVNKEEFHKEALRSAITGLVNDPHVPLITSTAIHMGEKEKIIGKEYPPAMPFYNVARLLPKLREKDLSAKTEPLCTAGPTKCCDRKFSCYSSCPPCRDHECLGMCGNTCLCWPLVCGNCCFNMGCCLHDYCCQEHGYLSFGCLNVIGLTCEQFVCPA